MGSSTLRTVAGVCHHDCPDSCGWVVTVEDGTIGLGFIGGAKGAAAAVALKEQVRDLVVGKERTFETHNDMHKRFWTWSYPTKALLPMGALTKLAASTPVEAIKQPVLMIYSETDKVIRPDLVKSMSARWGGGATLTALAKNEDPSSHVIAGDALSPGSTDEVAGMIIDWVKSQGL